MKSTTKNPILARVAKEWLVAVVRAETDDQARRIAGALLAGGVSAIEITYTCPDPPSIIRALVKEAPRKLVVGAGTVSDRAAAAAALDAGAQFIVSPGIVEEVIAEARGRGVAVMAGAVTPTEILTALRLGADVIKFFPGSLFGPDYVRAVRGPFPDLRIMPTGGVSLSNLKEWMDAGVFAVGVGTELVPKEAVQAGRYDVVTGKAREFAEAVRRVRLPIRET